MESSYFSTTTHKPNVICIDFEYSLQVWDMNNIAAYNFLVDLHKSQLLCLQIWKTFEH